MEQKLPLPTFTEERARQKNASGQGYRNYGNEN
jgi:hypothetical protein